MQDVLWLELDDVTRHCRLNRELHRLNRLNRKLHRHLQVVTLQEWLALHEWLQQALVCVVMAAVVMAS